MIDDRWKSGWRLLLAEALFLAVLLVGGASAGLLVGAVQRAAAADLPAGAVGTSCVVSMDGASSGSATVAWSAGATVRTYFRCSVGPDLTNTTGYTNWRGDVPDANCQVNIGGQSGTAHVSVASPGARYWTNFTVSATVGGIFDGYFDVYQPSSGSATASGWVDAALQIAGGTGCSAYRSGKLAVARVHMTNAVNPSPGNTAEVKYPTGVSVAGFASAQPAYVYNPHGCSALGVTVSPDPIAANGTLGVAVTGTPASGTVLELKRPTAAAWQAVSTVPGTSSVTGFPAPTAVSSVVFRCKTTGSPTYLYMTGSTSGGTWVTTEPIVTACALATLSWPGTTASSTTATFKYAIPAGVTILSLQWAVIDPNDTPSAPTASTSWTSAVTNVTGANTSSISVTVTSGVSLAQVWWRCQDSSGWHSNGQYAASFALGAGAFGGGDGSCWDSGGIGLAPSSWVPGLLHGMGCLAQDLVVPDESAVTEFAESAESLSSKAPIAYITETGAELVDVFSDTPGRIETNRSTCLIIFEENPATGGAMTVCPSAFDDAPESPGTGQTVLEAYRTLMGVLFWAGAIYLLYQATRRVLSS